MTLYKVTDRTRGIKKLCFGDSLNNFLVSCTKKFKFTCVKVVTEKEGCEVEEDEELVALSDCLLMVLAEGQEWAPAPPADSEAQENTAGTAVALAEPPCPDEGVPEISTASPAPSSGTVMSPCSSSPMVEPGAPMQNLKETCGQSQPFSSPPGEMTRSLPNETPTPGPSSTDTRPHKVQLPQSFTPKIENQLKEGSLNGATIDQLVAELSWHFLHKCPIRDPGEYKQVERLLAARYPNVKSAADNPWSLVRRKLSKKNRNERLKMKYKSLQSLHQGPPLKRRALFKSKEENKEGGRKLEETEYQACLTQLNSEWKKAEQDRSPEQIKLLLKETYANRAAWISSDAEATIHTILEKFECLTDMEYLLYEYKLRRGEENFQKEIQNLRTFFEAVLELMTPHPRGSETQTQLQTIRFVEKSTALDKGKGRKTEAIFTLKQGIAETDIDRNLVSSPGSAPRAVLFVDDSNNLMEAALLADGIAIFAKTSSVIQTLHSLIMLYYIADLNYPRIYSQLLGILQHYVLEDKVDFKGYGNKFRKFALSLEATGKFDK